MNLDTTAWIILGLALFLLGADLILIAYGLGDALHGNTLAWSRLSARAGYFGLIALVIDQILQNGAPKTPRDWFFVIALSLTSVGFVGLVFELRKGRNV